MIVNDEFKHIGNMLIPILNRYEFNKKMKEYHVQTQTLNPNYEVKLETTPKLEEVTFNDYKAIGFSVHVYLKNKE